MFALRNEGPGEIFYATRESAGFDICASEDMDIGPGQWKLVRTGLRIVESQIPPPLNWEGVLLKLLPELQIRPRSGLAAKHGVSILNTPCTIDADYRGEIKIPMINHGQTSFQVHKGERIAQGVCALVFHAPNIPVRDVVRGEGGFGSTGSKTGLT